MSARSEGVRGDRPPAARARPRRLRARGESAAARAGCRRPTARRGFASRSGYGHIPGRTPSPTRSGGPQGRAVPRSRSAETIPVMRHAWVLAVALVALPGVLGGSRPRGAPHVTVTLLDATQAPTPVACYLLLSATTRPPSSRGASDRRRRHLDPEAPAGVVHGGNSCNNPVAFLGQAVPVDADGDGDGRARRDPCPHGRGERRGGADHRRDRGERRQRDAGRRRAGERHDLPARPLEGQHRLGVDADGAGPPASSSMPCGPPATPTASPWPAPRRWRCRRPRRQGARARAHRRSGARRRPGVGRSRGVRRPRPSALAVRRCRSRSTCGSRSRRCRRRPRTGLDLVGEVSGDRPRAIDTDLRLAFGGTGGPVFDTSGAVVGLTSSLADADASRRRGDAPMVRLSTLCEAMSRVVPTLAAGSPPSSGRLPVEPRPIAEVVTVRRPPRPPLRPPRQGVPPALLVAPGTAAATAVAVASATSTSPS